MVLFTIISSQCKVVLCSYVHVFVYFDICVCSLVLCSYICCFICICICEVFYGVYWYIWTSGVCYVFVVFLYLCVFVHICIVTCLIVCAFMCLCVQVKPTTEKIDVEKLKVRDKIHFYADILLFEDELSDNGCSVLRVKIVSNTCSQEHFSTVLGKLHHHKNQLSSI